MAKDFCDILIMPGNSGEDCPFNGEHEGIDCRCDECDYMLCCVDVDFGEEKKDCRACTDPHCPRQKKKLNQYFGASG